MDNLEQKLIHAPKHKLGFKADLKIKARLYKMIVLGKINNFTKPFIFKSLFLNRAMVVALMIFIILGSTSFYAYGSEQVTLGNTLYPLKLTVENVKNHLIPTSASKVKNYNDLSTRRLEEALRLSSKQQEADNHIVETIDRAVENVGKSAEAITKISNSQESKEAVIKLRENSNNNLQVLEEIEKNTNIKEHQDIARKISEAREAIERYDDSLEDEKEDDDSIDDDDEKDDEEDEGDKKSRGHKNKKENR